jgi:hypothetical protein
MQDLAYQTKAWNGRSKTWKDHALDDYNASIILLSHVAVSSSKLSPRSASSEGPVSE